MAKRSAPAVKRTQVVSGAVQKAASSADATGTWQNSRLPLRPELQAALKMKSQASKPQD